MFDLADDWIWSKQKVLCSVVPTFTLTWRELLLLKSCLLGLESLRGALYIIKAWDNVHHSYLFMSSLGLQKEKLCPLRHRRLWKKNYFWHQSERVMFHNAGGVSDDACVPFASPPVTIYYETPFLSLCLNDLGLQYMSQTLTLAGVVSFLTPPFAN